MKVYLAVVLLCLLGYDQGFGRKSSHKSSRHQCCRKQCRSLKVGSDIVTTNEFMSQIVGNDWLIMYCESFGLGPINDEKVKSRWTMTGSTVTRQTAVAKPNESCDYQFFNLNVVDNTCGIELNQVNGDLFERFSSQDPETYLLTIICFMPNADGSCAMGFIDVQVPDKRTMCTDTSPLCPNGPGPLSEPDLTMLPWEKINQDWFKVTCAYFPAAKFPQFSWKGNECPFVTEP